MNKKRKIPPIENTVTSEKQFINFPLIEFTQSIDICKHIFSFVKPYCCIFKFVSKQWYKFFKDNGNSLISNFINFDKLMKSICDSNEFNLFEWLFINQIFTAGNRKNLCQTSIEYGNLDMFKYAYKDGCLFDSEKCSYMAAGEGHLHCLKWLYENGSDFDDIYLCAKAARYGHLDCLKYIFPHLSVHVCRCGNMDIGVLLHTETICKYASSGGNLDCLKWLRENGCDWNEQTCSYAAYNGHLDCLKWARENGCPWDEHTCSDAALNGHLDCLEWAKENGCPYDESDSD